MRLILAAALALNMVNATYSPDSTKVAYTSDNDIYVMNVADSVSTRLTFDGSDLILNGYASWVYYEEIFGRPSKYRAFWWSPDSKKIGFYRFDNTLVPMFPIYSPFGQDGTLSQTRYPKAGETNPSVKIGFVNLDSPSDIVWADFEDDSDQYFGTPFWGEDSKELYVQREPRRQSQLDLYAVSAATGAKRLVYHEEYPTWVEFITGMLFTSKGLYMARNFESLWEQIYFLGYDGTLKRLTDGQNWDTELLKVDEKKGDLWFVSKRDDRLHPALYHLDRKGRITALTDPSYYASKVRISDDGKSFSAELSNARTPMQKVSGSLFAKTPVSIVPGERPEGPCAEIVKIGNDGFDLYGLVSLPKDFDPSRKYPVIMTLYGGPGTPYAIDRWKDRDASNNWAWENGIITIVCDPRSSGENGRRGMDEAFRRMTVIELQDYIAWAKWLGTLGYVDKSRIGVQGFSFGGTTTSMLVLRYPEYFCCGVAGGGVYSWHLYDTCYTERFMDTPAANPDGYSVASVLTHVPSLDPASVSGHLKLTHGTGDDNVHFQNTLQLIDALQKAQIQFDLMIYPDGMHGYRGDQHRHDVAADHIFWAEHLLGTAAH